MRSGPHAPDPASSYCCLLSTCVVVTACGSLLRGIEEQGAVNSSTDPRNAMHLPFCRLLSLSLHQILRSQLAAHRRSASDALRGREESLALQIRRTLHCYSAASCRCHNCCIKHCTHSLLLTADLLRKHWGPGRDQMLHGSWQIKADAFDDAVVHDTCLAALYFCCIGQGQHPTQCRRGTRKEAVSIQRQDNFKEDGGRHKVLARAMCLRNLKHHDAQLHRSIWMKMGLSQLMHTRGLFHGTRQALQLQKHLSSDSRALAQQPARVMAMDIHVDWTDPRRLP